MITKQIAYIGDFAEEAKRLRANFGVTDKFSTGDKGLDDYLGGGFGRDNGYEVVLLYGDTGIGKSTIALNIMAPTIMKGTKVGFLILEDDMTDVSNRMQFILEDQWDHMNAQNNVYCLPEDALSKSWTLDDLLEYIESLFTKAGVELILLDHLQFAFEGAESVRGENEYISQRIFMQKLNHVVKKTKKTMILVSHVNKGPGKGMDKVQGSGSIAQASTKVIEVADDHGQARLWLRKTRFTERRGYPYHMQFNGTKLEAVE